MNPIEAAKQAIADTDVLYCQGELRAIMANLVEYHEATIAALIASYETPVRVTGFAPGFEVPNDALDYSNYK